MAEGSRRKVSGLDAVLHAIALTLNDDGLGMVEDSVEDCGGECGVVVEDAGLVLEDLVGTQDALTHAVQPANLPNTPRIASWTRRSGVISMRLFSVRAYHLRAGVPSQPIGMSHRRPLRASRETSCPTSSGAASSAARPHV